MIMISVIVDAPVGSAQMAKEVLAMSLEAVGIVRVVDIQEVPPEQMKIKM